MLSLLDSPDNICKRYASLALANLVSNDSIAPNFVEFGVLEAMLPYAIDENCDMEVKRYCMLAVANMAAMNETHVTILQNLKFCLFGFNFAFFFNFLKIMLTHIKNIKPHTLTHILYIDINL